VDLRLQLTWPTRDKPDDYQVLNESQPIGRIFRTRASMGLGDRWIPAFEIIPLSHRNAVLDFGGTRALLKR
jgi:hypothetical protein